MKKIVILSIAIIYSLILLNSAQAQERTFGIGGIIGDPDGISVKAWISESTAIAGAISVDLGENYSWLSVHADFLKQNTVVTWEEALLQTHYGGGVRIVSGDFQDYIALRAPVGIDVNAIDAPVEVFMEVVPTIDVDPEFYFYFSGAMGFRYFFGNN
ncbi:hypothetical protein [Rhodohalobacter sulfatireducens]|uniref:Outer membrane protein beta-barrel domain-containing protein n=1 Tax=Rhodohalobacter sulfatireducens TaxID=2911366 RepID=A0ABS9KFM5_9BACT|nr:hypothetical protein [Rhodohalobacter sulfatireducens]MCG2589643.1 hypothetical protein [Rhodohalobacter sulfatireducens]MDR9364501.1 hypothetical protein [Balneolaceae bacterium]MDR9407503.1 hypothetical protein [Balneolaceae bacterium]